jgi:1,4-alpha-glucan branching enzyme
MKKDPYGVFEVVIPAKDGQPAIAHNSKIKVRKLQSAAASIADLADFHDHALRRAN